MIRIRTLGGLSASRDDQGPSGAAIQPRRLAVLALVARTGDRGITRERLLALLWPDAEAEAGRRALSQALHTLRVDLVDDLFLGVQELRLNLAAARCDVLDFEAALAGREWERAAAAYGGPFLHGFRLAGAAEFDRWMEEEQTHLAHRYTEVLERLAEVSAERGDPAAAVNWWRKRAALDPLNARVTVELMRALAAAGERHSAVQQARIYQSLLGQQPDLEPDPAVAQELEALRRTLAEPPPPPPSHAAPAEAPVRPEPSAPAPATVLLHGARGRTRWAAATALVLLVAVALLVSFARRRTAPEAVPLLAVGAITDYREDATAAPLTDMLATNLARIAGLQVVSTVRLLELVPPDDRDPGAASYATAARRAGATDLVEGGLHAVTGGFRLELRRVGLADGRLRGAWRIEGSDLFALVDSATAAFARSLGTSAALGPGNAGTRSLVAWRFYEEGLRELARGDHHTALGLFEASLREDSSFAMAAYYRARSAHALTGSPYPPDDLIRLERLAAGAADRERLQILAWVAHTTQSPALDALADTFNTRYPAALEAQYLAGLARMARAEFAAALPYLHRVVAADTSPARTGGGPCRACEALPYLLYAYHALDSVPRMERIARDWVRRDSTSGPAWASMATVLDITGHPDAAIEARRRATPFNESDEDFAVGVRIREGDFMAADRAARAVIAEGSSLESSWHGFLMLSISLHHQARWRELLAENAARFAALSPGERAGRRGSRLRMSDALALLDAGHPVESGRILDSMIQHFDPALPTGVRDRDLTMLLALRAEAALAAGDTAMVARAADSASAAAIRAAKAREMGFATHAQALAALARLDTATAIATFERAIYSPTLGYTRTNHHLARLYLARGEPRRAVGPLQAALRGEIGLVSFTRLHQALASAWDDLGAADSAEVHRRWVASALRYADPPPSGEAEEDYETVDEPKR